MSEYRRDPLTGRDVIIAANRAERPDEFAHPAYVRGAAECPFCAGHEQQTPEAIAVYPPREAGPGGWQVRVVANKYPAVSAAAPLAPSPDDLLQRRNCCGRHEVVIESPDHLTSFSQLGDEQAQYAFAAYRDRLGALAQVEGVSFASVFKNCGPAAGASVEHVHSQILALDHTPLDAQRKLDNALQFRRRTGKNLLPALLEAERRAGERIVAETANFVAFCPFASRMPYEIWVASAQPAGRFEATADAPLAELALLVRRLVSALETMLDRTAYNFVIDTAPFDTDRIDHYDWHMEIFPRITRLAGFEWSTACFVNPVAPEDAAKQFAAALSQGGKG